MLVVGFLAARTRYKKQCKHTSKKASKTKLKKIKTRSRMIRERIKNHPETLQNRPKMVRKRSQEGQDIKPASSRRPGSPRGADYPAIPYNLRHDLEAKITQQNVIKTTSDYNEYTKETGQRRNVVLCHIESLFHASTLAMVEHSN